MKKLISILAIIAIVCTMFTGCGSKSGKVSKDDPNEQVTLVIALPKAKQKDSDKVVAEINKKLETLLPNTKIELLLEASMAEKWSLWMSTKKKIDIAHSGFVTSLETEVLKKSYEPLDDLVKEYAPNIEKLQKDYWTIYDNATINGSLYAIPNMQSHVNKSHAIKIHKKAVKYVDTTALVKEAWSSSKTTEKFWNILSEGLENAEKHGVDCGSIASLTLLSIAQRGYAFVGGEDSNICYDLSSDSGKLLNFYETDEYKYLCNFMTYGAKKGWVSQDILTGQWSDGLYGSYASLWKADKKTGLFPESEKENSTSIIIDNPETPITLTTNIGDQSTYYSIPFTSQHPARAMKFLDLINSEEGAEIVNLLAYGIEGEHYEFVDKEKGDIKAFEYEGQGSDSVSYSIPNWMCGNMLTAGQYSVYPYDHTEKEYAIDYYTNKMANANKHVLYGFTFDLTPVSSKLSSIIKNNGEYAECIYSGIDKNADAKIKELESKNKAAGWDEVVKTLQKQADDYIASKK